MKSRNIACMAVLLFMQILASFLGKDSYAAMRYHDELENDHE